MEKITFITGNKDKAEYLAKFLGVEVACQKIDLLEIQSLNLQDVVYHKVREAYNKIKKPVLVEDVALEIDSLGGLPGPFIKWFLESIGNPGICKVTEGSRTAIARCIFGFYDGKIEHYFESSLAGTIAKKTKGKNGYGWDAIFIPQGYSITRAQMNQADNAKTYNQIRPFAQLKQFIEDYI